MTRILAGITGVAVAVVLVTASDAGAVASAATPTPTPTATTSPTVCPPGPLTMAVLTGDVLTWPNLPVSAQPFEIDVRFCDHNFHYEVAGTATSFHLPSEAMAAIDCCGTRNILVSSAGLCSQAFVEVTSPAPSCLPPPTATPAAIQAPPTGDSRNSSPTPRLGLAVLGLALLAGGLASFAAFRHGKARN